jgi:hypothetical protein
LRSIVARIETTDGSARGAWVIRAAIVVTSRSRGAQNDARAAAVVCLGAASFAMKPSSV